MKTAPIVPAPLQRDEHGVPWSAEYADVYHPRVGPIVQARHVFLGGNRLPERWRARERFVVLETGFGLGNNFLATWQAWRDDPARCERLDFVSIERHPLRREDLRRVHTESPHGDPAFAALGVLGAQLADAWPALTPNLHRLVFEGGRVQLHLALGDVQDWLPELRLRADAIYLDGFAPARNPRMWDRRVCAALGRLAAPGATLATWSAASALRDDLTTAGFDVRLAQGTGGKRDITLATFAPRHRRANGALPPHAPMQGGERRALIVGAGLAGCAVADALAEQGWRSRVFERRPRIAAEASGNPAGLFHGIVHADDGPHARAHRAASFEAQRSVLRAIGPHAAAGAANGLLRVEHRLDAARMHEQLAALGLPPEYVQALDADAASERAGVRLSAPAWLFAGGGWVDPGALAASFIGAAGEAVESSLGVEVEAVRRVGGLWQVVDRDGRVVDAAPVLVIAGAAEAARLLPSAPWPLRSVRGQLSWLDAARHPALADSLAVRLPIADAGYLLPQANGRVVFGATSTVGDADPQVRGDDHRANVAKLDRLLGRANGVEVSMLEGRTAWRCIAPDRLPLAGAVGALDEAAWQAAMRRDQMRFVPREPGLFVFTALGSRGITWAALGARVLGSAIAGGVAPLETSLLEALDPARFVVRAARHDDGSGQG